MAKKLSQAPVMVFWWISMFGAWVFMASVYTSKDKTPQPEGPSVSADSSSHLRTQQVRQSYFSRILRPMRDTLRDLGRPQSVWIPMISTAIALLSSFRALQNHHISLMGVDNYQVACPEGSRRTATGAVVKLLAATVTTIGIRGHLNSLIDIRSWKFELFRALEVIFMPLAALFSFSDAFWYGFADLLHLGAGPWRSPITLKYRLGRLCGAYITSTTSKERRFSLGFVSPQHLETTQSRRDVKWTGRVTILIILLGQYAQAGVLLSRRILSNTAGGVDYAMSFLVINGVAALVQSLIILLLNVSWSLRTDIQPCTAKLCTLPECTLSKQEQELPTYEVNRRALGFELVSVARRILYGMAGGLLQLHILWSPEKGTWKILYNLWTLKLVWESSIFYIVVLDSFKRLALGARTSEDAHVQSQEPTRDPTVTEPEGATGSDCNIIISALMFVGGILSILWLLFIITVQLLALFPPCILMYWQIATELASWKHTDLVQPCPQLWKDYLEDELWWF